MVVCAGQGDQEKRRAAQHLHILKRGNIKCKPTLRGKMEWTWEVCLAEKVVY